MKTFDRVCAQGDIYITRIDALPAGIVPVAPEDGRVIVTHSETGHHHVMLAERTKAWRLPDSIMDIFLAVEHGDTLEHLRPHDTHEAIAFEPGLYHVRRQREYVPEGFRRVED
ncbi:hypothetical protein [Reyranella sp.]|uniref:hypothetical protein n=1 Tax=Reyranella sp. TaxID=1929291 RepID=UPI003D0DCFCF